MRRHRNVTLGVLLLAFAAGTVIEPACAQTKPDAKKPEAKPKTEIKLPGGEHLSPEEVEKLSPEEWRQVRHGETLEAWKEFERLREEYTNLLIKGAGDAKTLKEVEDKKKELEKAEGKLDNAIKSEAYWAPEVKKALKERHQRWDDWYKSRYSKEAEKTLREAKKRYEEALDKERQRIKDSLEEGKQPSLPPPEKTGMQGGPNLELASMFGSAVTVYGGVNIGGATQDAAVSWNPNFVPLDAVGVAALSRATLNQTGFTGGGQIGVLAQWGQVTAGICVDANGKGGDTTRNTVFFSPFGGGFPMRQTFISNFEMTVRGRIGYVLPVSPGLSLMPYGTAGLAVEQLKVSDAMYFPTSFNFGSRSQFRPGWTAGGGVEFITSLPFRIQLQYLFMDFGDISYIALNSAAPAPFIWTRHRLTNNRATLGLNVPLQNVPGLLGF